MVQHFTKKTTVRIAMMEQESMTTRRTVEDVDVRDLASSIVLCAVSNRLKNEDEL